MGNHLEHNGTRCHMARVKPEPGGGVFSFEVAKAAPPRNRAGFRTCSYLMQEVFHGFPPPPDGNYIRRSFLLLLRWYSFHIVLYSPHFIVCYFRRSCRWPIFNKALYRIFVTCQSSAESCRMPQIVQVTGTLHRCSRWGKQEYTSV
ncbi:hypothetical protein PILCRDRAFT_557662 [Piloderma croceum F 1598]|uniref:Uncharacterized protein n=1 Tax=Piloderma croceum (strain F 1598) TaxID=765440 RepID=A0A0C3FIE3_PILCF|nr:hypothetical protein PILCRDRAFT_557662 [Piloderma croceum F 1598]